VESATCPISIGGAGGGFRKSPQAGKLVVELPKFRDANGLLRRDSRSPCPEEVRGPMGDVVLDALIERRLAVKRSRR
jgi:hypothetical protein